MEFVEVLERIYDLCQDVRDKEQMCRSVHERLQLFQQVLAGMSTEEQGDHTAVINKYKVLVDDVVQFLEEQRQKWFLLRLVTNRKAVKQIEDFSEHINMLEKEMDVRHYRETCVMRQEMKEMKIEQERILLEAKTSINFLVTELQQRGAKGEEDVAMLQYELTYKADENSAETHELMEATCKRIKKQPSIRVPEEVPEWFISRDDVAFRLDESFDQGCYGDVRRGTWMKSTVVIKCLLVNDEMAKQEFLKETKVWYMLNYPHVIKLYGACHVGDPFFVSEDATHGNFFNYFQKDTKGQMQHKDEVWQLFYEAALGLQYLHSKKVVHGDLKCNNILIGGDHKAKICDFGFAFIRGESRAMSQKAQTDAVRWKAPECLGYVSEKTPNSTHNPRFASDVYSLGMCIIEAFLGEPPYSTDDDEIVVGYIMEKREYPRPGGFEDDEWKLVQRMCLHDWEDRISLSVAVDELERFAQRATGAQLATKAAQCSEGATGIARSAPTAA